jgi:hypothetical protein
MTLNDMDAKIFKAIYQKTLENGTEILSAKDLGINEIDLTDPLEMLSRYNYVDLSLSTIVSATIRITPTGFYAYASQFDKAKYALFELVADQIINKKEYNSNMIAKSLNISTLIIHLILHYFRDIGELKISEYMDGRIEIDHVGVELKRKYQKRNGA